MESPPLCARGEKPGVEESSDAQSRIPGLFPTNIYPPIQKKITEHLLCARSCTEHWVRGKKKKERQKSLSSETAELQWGRNESLDDDSKIDADSDVPKRRKQGSLVPGLEGGRRMLYHASGLLVQKIQGTEHQTSRAWRAESGSRLPGGKWGQEQSGGYLTAGRLTSRTLPCGFAHCSKSQVLPVRGFPIETDVFCG